MENDITDEEYYVVLKAYEAIKQHLEGQVIVKIIYIPHKVINFVTKPI